MDKEQKKPFTADRFDCKYQGKEIKHSKIVQGIKCIDGAIVKTNKSCEIDEKLVFQGEEAVMPDEVTRRCENGTMKLERCKEQHSRFNSSSTIIIHWTFQIMERL